MLEITIHPFVGLQTFNLKAITCSSCSQCELGEESDIEIRKEMGRRRQCSRKHVSDALNFTKTLFRCRFTQFVIKCYISDISIGTLQASMHAPDRKGHLYC